MERRQRSMDEGRKVEGNQNKKERMIEKWNGERKKERKKLIDEYKKE